MLHNTGSLRNKDDLFLYEFSNIILPIFITAYYKNQNINLLKFSCLYLLESSSINLINQKDFYLSYLFLYLLKRIP